MKGLPLSFVALGMGGAVLGDVLHVRCGLAAAAALNPRDQEDSGLLLGANSLGCSDIGILITTGLSVGLELLPLSHLLFVTQIVDELRHVVEVLVLQLGQGSLGQGLVLLGLGLLLLFLRLLLLVLLGCLQDALLDGRLLPHRHDRQKAGKGRQLLLWKPKAAV